MKMSQQQRQATKSHDNNDSIVLAEGEWRRPVNDLRQQHVGGGHKSVHDDETAAKLGFVDGAPIHGTVHFSQLTPLLLKVYGKTWFERGTISVSFRNPVAHLQPVKAFISTTKSEYKNAIPPKQVRVWMEHLDGRLVFDGTASLGDDVGKTKVDRLLKRVKPTKGNLVFLPHPVGTQSLGVEKARIEWGNIIGDLFPFTPEQKLQVITEWHPWFSQEASHGSSPWGKAILPPEGLNQIMFYTLPKSNWPPAPYNLLPTKTTPVGLFGGCEIKLHAGPVFVGDTYYITRELIAVGETPRTEFRWMKTTMKDSSGKSIAEMTLQDMMLKSSIENYMELRQLANRHQPSSKL